MIPGMDPAPTIMGAYYRRTREDRATEVLATVLQAVPAFVAQLAHRLGLPRGDAYEVGTQIGSGPIIDLEIKARSTDGQPTWLLWSEHKVTDPLTAQQLIDEEKALAARAGALTRRLVAITLYPPQMAVAAKAKAMDVTLLRWSDVFRMATNATIELESQPEQGSERCPELGALQRHLLAEWRAFSEQELEATVEALTSDRVNMLLEASKGIETIQHLLVEGFRGACAAVGASQPKEAERQQRSAPPADSWFEERGWKLYAHYEFEETWATAGAEAPALIAGAWAEGDDADVVRQDVALRCLFAQRGFNHWDEPGKHGWIEFAKSLALADLAASDDVDSQMQAVEQFFECVLGELLALGG